MPTLTSRLCRQLLPLLAATALGCAHPNPPASDISRSAPLAKITVSHATNYRVINADWGSLTWFVSGEQGNSSTMTVGQAVIKPGQQSPRHLHPNCEEVLHVIKGTILHTVDGGKTEQLAAGDTVTIPPNIAHNARNIGAGDAVMIISFSTPNRKAVNQP